MDSEKAQAAAIFILLLPETFSLIHIKGGNSAWKLTQARRRYPHRFYCL